MMHAHTPPGPPGHILLGNLLQFLRNPLEFLSQCAQEYGDVAQIRLFGMVVYLCHNPDHIEFVLRSNHRNFIKDKLTRRRTALLGHDLLRSEGVYWRRQRRLLQPGFQPHQLQHYSTVITACTERMVQDWQDGQQRDIHADMMRLTLEIATKTLFDADITVELQAVETALERVMDYSLKPLHWFLPYHWVPTPATFRLHRAWRHLDRTIDAIIQHHRSSRYHLGGLLSQLLAARDNEAYQMTDQQLRDEVMTLFFARHETTALTLSYCWYLLARHADAKRTFVAELDTVLGGRTPTMADVPRLRYTGWIVKESMRLYPPTWSIGREALHDCTLGGYHVPQGTQLWLNPWVVHRDPRWFAEPEVFKPERWDDDRAARLPRGSHIPFGDAPRVCLGNHVVTLAAVLVLAVIGQHSCLTLVSDQALQLVPAITLRPKHGIQMVGHTRHVEGPACRETNNVPHRHGADPQEHAACA